MLLECRSRKAVPALIANSADSCDDVRFWCVFALGRLRRETRSNPRKLMPRRRIIRALEARVHDHGDPQYAVQGWTVHHEAIAQLKNDLFRETLDRAVSDPINHPDLWRWGHQYATQRELKQREAIVFETAIRVLKDPVNNRHLFRWAPEYYMTRRGRHLYYEAAKILKANKINPAELGPRPDSGTHHRAAKPWFIA